MSLHPSEKAEMLAKAARGELTPEDTRRFIEATRASFLSRAAAKAEKAPTTARKPKIDPNADVDFF